jgi:hypothetical protein
LLAGVAGAIDTGESQSFLVLFFKKELLPWLLPSSKKRPDPAVGGIGPFPFTLRHYEA